MSRQNDYALGNSKPLIQRDQNFVLDRKLVTVHSEDRDITKWPNSNTFEIILPETLLNVQSMRLIQATIPGKFFVFSNEYQNTKFTFTMASSDVSHNITIEEGYYTPEQLAVELETKMNKTVGDGTTTTFNVFYDEVAQKYWFGNTDSSFNLHFCEQIPYELIKCEQPLTWPNHTNWGLPYHLGFQKKCYSSKYDPSGITFDYISACTNNTTDLSNILHYVKAPLSFTIGGDTCLYMEVDKYNSYDELYPYNESSKQMYNNNAYAGKVNSAFAKIPIKEHDKNSFDSRTFYLHNLVHYDPPIERVARLKFKFRFHDGRLVDFQNYPFDFTIEFNCLRNEMDKKYSIRIPATFIL